MGEVRDGSERKYFIIGMNFVLWILWMCKRW